VACVDCVQMRIVILAADDVSDLVYNLQRSLYYISVASKASLRYRVVAGGRREVAPP